MDDAAPVRITFERGSAAAVNRRFIGGFFAFAILFAGAAFYRPAIQAFAVGFPIYLILWKLRLRSASRPGWALTVAENRLSLEAVNRSRSVEREEGDVVRIIRSESRFGPKAELLVLNSSKPALFRLEIDELDCDRITAALGAKGWTVV
jgi:hypothetical protein